MNKQKPPATSAGAKKAGIKSAAAASAVPMDVLFGSPRPGADPANTGASLFPPNGPPSSPFQASGTIDAGTTITRIRLFLADGTSYVVDGANIVFPTATTWTATFGVTSLPPGTQPCRLLIESATNTSESSHGLTFSIPVPSLTFAATETNQNVVVSGVASNASGLRVNVNSALQSSTMDSSGNFSFTATPGTGDSTCNIVITVTDTANNNYTFEYDYTLDTTPPTLAITSPPGATNSTKISGTITDNKPGTIQITATENGAPVGAALAVVIPADLSPQAFSFDTGLADGSHTVILIATDDAGNVTDSSGFTFVLDTQALLASSVVYLPLMTAIDVVYNKSTLTSSAVDPANYALSNSTGAAMPTITPSPDNNVIQLSLSDVLPAAGTNTLTITSGGVADQAGNPLSGTLIFPLAAPAVAAKPA